MRLVQITSTRVVQVPTRSLMARFIVCLLGFIGLTSNLAFADPFVVPLEGLSKIEPANVVRFKVVGKKIDAIKPVLELALETRGGFKIYHHGLEFRMRVFAGQDNVVDFMSDPAPLKAFDPWYQEDRETHSSGALFALTTESTERDLLRIRFEACSVNTCLLPVWFEIIPLVGEISVQGERADRKQDAASLLAQANQERVQISKVDGSSDPFAVDFSKPKAAIESSPEPSLPISVKSGTGDDAGAPQAPSGLVISWTDHVTVFVQESLTGRSFWLFPALLLAGLLMNLTPCVYPMIPITLNVLGRLGHHSPSSLHGAGQKGSEKADEHWTEGVIRAAIYVLGIVSTYSAMGVIAGMTGTLFGSLLQSSAVLVGLSVLFVVLAFAMLGVIDFTKAQVWASRIPISEKYPHFGVFTMGAVSGLVSAPCTGPVLSAILVLIGKSQDPVYGFSLMAFFSLGFGLPYLFLGVFAHNLKRLPRAGRLLEFVKTIFAALLFGLSLYYIKPVLSHIPQFELLFVQPSQLLVGILFAVSVLLWFNSSDEPGAKRGMVSKINKGAMLLCLTALSMWFCLFVTNGFTAVRPQSSDREASVLGASQVPVGVIWEKDWKKAQALAKNQNKGLIVDAWAQWCAACLKMDAELWSEPEVAAWLLEHYIPVKLDFTTSSALTDSIADQWDISGLPAVAIFPPGSDFNALPQVLFRQEVRKAELRQVLDDLGHQ